MDAVDNYIPMPERETDKPFMMPVEDVFSIKGRGTVVTGRIDRGMIHTGDPVEIVGLQEKSIGLGGKRVWKCSTSCWTRAWRATT